jgi:hypothetical protein
MSFGLSLLTSQPVLPADIAPSLCAATINVDGRRACEQSQTEIATVYDAQEKVWKRWTLNVNRGNNGTSINLSTSDDGKSWTTAEQPCLTVPEGAWDRNMSSPVVIYNQSAADGRRYLLWYVGSSTGTVFHRGMAEGGIGMATSADGRKFEPLAESESPYKVAGLILKGQDAFPGQTQVASAEFGAPRCVRDQNNWQVTYSKLGFDSHGVVAAAGIERATSDDGTRWQVVSDDPLSLEVVGAGAHTDRVLDELQRLAAACDVTQ